MQEQHQHLRHEAQHRADTGHDTVENQAAEPVGSAGGLQSRRRPETGMPGTHTP